MLTSYEQDTARLLGDPNQLFWTDALLDPLINMARRWMAVRTFCCRALITSLSTTGGQETYSLSLADAAVAALPGFLAPYGLLGISSQQANYFPALGRSDFPTLQADWRILNGTFQNYPSYFSTFGRGSGATVYLSPVPAAAYQMWWDLACRPVDLTDDTTPEAIPEPWQEIVPFESARRAAISQRRWEDVGALADECEHMYAEASRAEIPFLRPEWYSTSR